MKRKHWRTRAIENTRKKGKEEKRKKKKESRKRKKKKEKRKKEKGKGGRKPEENSFKKIWSMTPQRPL